MEWEKFIIYREPLMRSLRMKFHWISDNDFYDLFADAYQDGFTIFGENYDPLISNNEMGYLYRIVHNKFIDNYKKWKKWNDVIVLSEDVTKLNSIKEDIEPDEIEIESNYLTLSAFINRAIIHKGGDEKFNVENAPQYTVDKQYQNTIPLIKIEAWSHDKPLSQKTFSKISKKVEADTESENYFYWSEPMPIVRIINWIACS